MIYFISDTHFNHENIIKYCKRPFNSVEEMNNAIVLNWNNCVKNDDIVYHLGDFSLGRREDAFEIAQRLNGIKYIIRGNHDNWSANTYEEMGFIALKNAPIKLDELKLLLSHLPVPDKQIPNRYINIHGHIHDKKLFECIEKYDPKLFSADRHINVSCDVTEFKPISIEKII